MVRRLIVAAGGLAVLALAYLLFG